MQRYQSTLGLVINKKTSKESDLVITLLTPHSGKVIAFAKGAKNIKSTRLGNLQLGNTIKVQLYQKDDFNWISDSQTISPFLQKSKNLTQLNLLFYFLEIVNQLIAENQQIENIFEISQKVISAIDKNQFTLYIQNEINFLELLGFGLPNEIKTSFYKKDYKTSQKLIQRFFESITEKPLQSNKLFN